MFDFMAPGRNSVHAGVFCLFLVLGILVVYWPVTGYDLITYDDPEYVTNNLQVREGLSWSGVQWAFTHAWQAEWHPLTMISHMADSELYGGSASGRHFSNLLLHVTNTLVLLFFLWSITGSFWCSAMVSAFFALHPLNVEAVAWISERKGLLSTLFGLLSLWAYARYVKALQDEKEKLCSAEGKGLGHYLRKPAAFYVLAMALLALGLLCKPMLITWPGVMLLLDYWPLRRFPDSSLREQVPVFRRLLAEKLPFVVLSLASCAMALLVGRNAGALANTAQIPIAARVLNSLMAYGLYMQKLVCPANLSINYPLVEHWPFWTVLAATTVVGGLSAIVLWQQTERPYLAVGWLWFLSTLLPVIGLVHFANHIIADRYAYVTAIGLFMMLVWAGAELVGTGAKRRIIAFVVMPIVLTACAIRAQSQLRYWQSSETLFRHALAVNKNDFVAYENLGFYFDTCKELAQAEHCYRTALAINPASTFAMERLASLMVSKGNNAEAVALAEEALRLEGQGHGAYYAHSTLGLALMKLGKRADALEHYNEAIRLKPEFAPAYYNLANALAAEGHFEQAVEQYQQALHWDSASEDAHNNLAYLLARQGKLPQAQEEFGAALTLRPGMWQAEYGLGDVLSRLGHAKQADEHYRQALRSHPDFPEALTRLAWSLATDPEPQLRRGAEAVALAERACGLTGYNQTGSLRALAAAYAETGRFTEAVKWAEKAKDLALSAGQKELAQKLQAMTELFRAGSPYRETRNIAALNP